MTFSASRDSLLSCLQRAQTGLGTSFAPIEQNVLIEGCGQTIDFTCADGALRVRDKMTVGECKQGSTTLPIRFLISLLSRLPATEVTLASDKRDVTTITCGQHKSTLQGMPAKDFPAAVELGEADSFTLTQEDLKDRFKRISYAMSKRGDRPIYHGIEFKREGDQVTLAAQEGNHLAIASIKLENPTATPAQFIVPSRTITALASLLDSGLITIKFTTNQATFDFEGETLVSSRLIEGKFHDYKKLNFENAQKITVERELILDAARRCELFATDKEESILISLSRHNMDLSLDSTSGNSHDSLAIQYSGPEMRIGVAPKLLINALSHIPEDEITIEIVEPRLPLAIRSSGPSFASFAPRLIKTTPVPIETPAEEET